MSETETRVLLATSSKKMKEYRDAVKVFNEFKLLRKQLGNPIGPIADRKKVKKDLTGEDFFVILEEIRKRKH